MPRSTSTWPPSGSSSYSRAVSTRSVPVPVCCNATRDRPIITVSSLSGPKSYTATPAPAGSELTGQRAPLAARLAIGSATAEWVLGCASLVVTWLPPASKRSRSGASASKRRLREALAGLVAREVATGVGGADLEAGGHVELRLRLVGVALRPGVVVEEAGQPRGGPGAPEAVGPRVQVAARVVAVAADVGVATRAAHVAPLLRLVLDEVVVVAVELLDRIARAPWPSGAPPSGGARRS